MCFRIDHGIQCCSDHYSEFDRSASCFLGCFLDCIHFIVLPLVLCVSAYTVGYFPYVHRSSYYFFCSKFSASRSPNYAFLLLDLLCAVQLIGLRRSGCLAYMHAFLSLPLCMSQHGMCEFSGLEHYTLSVFVAGMFLMLCTFHPIVFDLGCPWFRWFDFPW